MTDIIVVGGGPAGLTAALYSKRAGKSVLVLEKESLGGQITMSPLVENYPGIKAMSGIDFADRLSSQVTDMGVDIEFDTVLSVEKEDGHFKVKTEFDEYECLSLIIASGAKARHLGLPNEEALTGNGVSYCAVCDGAFFKGKDVAITGGGSSALQEALFLSDLCNKVYLIHRRGEFRGEKSLADAVISRENIETVLNSNVVKLHGADSLSAVTVRSNNGAERVLDVSALFIAIGHEPDISFAKGLIAIDNGGYGIADETCTSSDGIFIAGDCRVKELRQLTTAVSDGANAAIGACRFIDEMR